MKTNSEAPAARSRIDDGGIQPPRWDRRGNGDDNDARLLLADLQRKPRLLVRALWQRRKHALPDRILTRTGWGDQVRRQMAHRGNRRNQSKAGRRGGAQRPVPRRRAHARTRRYQTRLLQRRTIRLRGQHRPHGRNRRNGCRRIRRDRDRGLSGGSPASACLADARGRNTTTISGESSWRTIARRGIRGEIYTPCSPRWT